MRFASVGLVGCVALSLLGGCSKKTESRGGGLSATQSATLTPVADSWLDEGKPDMNRGNANSLHVRAGSPARRPIVQFDLSSLPPCVTITSADLQLTTTWRPSASRGYSVRRLTESWQEGTGGKGSGATWDMRDGNAGWTTPGGSAEAAASANATSGATVHFDVTGDVTGMVAGSIPNDGWLVQDAAEGMGSVESAFGSKESSTPPTLAVSYTPCTAPADGGGATGAGGATDAGTTPAPGDGGTTQPSDLSTPTGGSGSGGGTVGTGCGTLPPLVEGKNAPTVVARSKPARGVYAQEPNFHTCFVRATDHAADGIANFARNDYSRREPYNANNSYYLIYASGGSWYIYDAATHQKVKQLAGPGGDAEPQWHPTDPNILYYLPTNGGTKMYALDVRTNTSTVVADFAGKVPWSGATHVWTKSEGSPSRDARLWGFQVEDASFNTLGFIVWDQTQNKVIGSMAATSRPDHVSMTPSGRWITISWDNGTWAYSPDFATKKQIHTTSEHSDLLVGANGHDIYVATDYSGNGYIFMVDIDTGVRTDLLPTYINGATTSTHFSGKAFAKPGWLLVGTYGGQGAPQWYSNKLFAMELAPNPRIYELAFHHSAVDDQYWAEPHAAVNRDFTRILVNSNWDVLGSADVDAYSVELPSNALP